MKPAPLYAAVFSLASMTLAAAIVVPLAQAQQDNDKPSASPAKEARENEPEKKRGRWNIRNGVDEGAKKVAKKAVPTTLTALARLPRPAALPDNKRIAPAETTLWTVDARVVSYDLHDDGDFHIVLKDRAGKTLIAELPDPDEVSGSPFVADMKTARQVFTKRFQPGNGEQKPKPGTASVRITGLGYFGRVQKPGLPNGLQLHPLTAVTPR